MHNNRFYVGIIIVIISIMKYVLFTFKFTFKRSVFLVGFSAILLVSIFTTAQPLYSEDLNWFLNTAAKNDYQLKILKNEQKNILLGIKKNNLDSVFSLTLSAENSGVSYSWADAASGEPLKVTSSPSVTIGLADPLETQVIAGADVTVGAGSEKGTSSLELYPSLSINQPLNKILGLENSTESQDIADKISIKEKEIEILKREIELKTLVLNKLKDVYAAEKELKTVDVNIMDAAKAFNDAVKLGTYNRESSKYLQLKYSLSKLKRQKELAFKTLKNKRAALERAVGSKFASIPESLPDVKLKLPSLDDIKNNPDMYLAYLRILKDKAKLNEQVTPDVPQLSAGVSVVRKGTDSTGISGSVKADTDISGTFKGVFEDFSVSAAVGGMVNSRTVYLRTGISWSLPDNRIKNIDEDISRNTIASDELQVKLLKDSFFSNLESIRLKLEDFKNRREGLKEDTEIAQLRLKEAETQVENGIISKEEFKDVQWQLDSLEYEKKAFLLDKLITGQDIGSLVLKDNLDN